MPFRYANVEWERKTLYVAHIFKQMIGVLKMLFGLQFIHQLNNLILSKYYTIEFGKLFFLFYRRKNIFFFDQ